MIATLLFVLAQLGGITIRDEGAFVCTARYVDLVGAGVTASCPAGVATLTITDANTTDPHGLLDGTIHHDTIPYGPLKGAMVASAADGFWDGLDGNTTTTKMFLTQTGDGVASAMPAWGGIVDADVPNTITVNLAAAATALAGNGSNCTLGNYARGVDASGNAEDCTAAGGGGAHTVLDGGTSHTDTDTYSPLAGSLITSVTNGTWGGLDGNQTTASQYLRSVGDGVNSIAPQWVQIPFSDLTGSVTDGQVPNTITIDLATVATTANAGDSATAFFSSGAIEIARGGHGQATAVAGFDALAPTTTAGDIIYHDGTDNVRLAAGTALYQLTMNAAGTAPTWTPANGTVLTSSGTVSDATSANYTAITGIAFTPLANTNYRMDCFIIYTSTAATTGINFAWDVPAAVTSIHMTGYTTTTALGANEGFSQRADNVGTPTSAAVVTVENVAFLTARLRNGANATSTTLGVTPETNNSVSVIVGSTCEIWTY